MDNIEKKLDALIDALGFDVETEKLVMKSRRQGHVNPLNGAIEYYNDDTTIIAGYKLTKRKEKPLDMSYSFKVSQWGWK